MNPETNIKIVLKRICDGFSKITYKDKDLYYKHLTIDEEAELEELYEISFKKAKETGAMSKDEKLAFLDTQGLWKKEEEEGLNKKEKYLDSLRKTRPKLVIEQQKEQLDKAIKEKEEEFYAEIKKRNRLVGETCETYASNKRDMGSIKLLSFKDKDFKERFFSDEEFDEMSDQELAYIFVLIAEENKIISTRNIKKLVVDNYFFNLYCLMDSASGWKFFDKPIIKLTQNQSVVLFLAKNFRFIRENNEIPKEIENDYDKTMEFVENSEKKKEILEKSKDREAFSAVGAKSSELKKLGIGDAGSVSPHQILRRSNKKALGKKDFMSG